MIVVEHDEEAIREADYVFDIGPGAGVHGGRWWPKARLNRCRQCGLCDRALSVWRGALKFQAHAGGKQKESHRAKGDGQ